MYVTGQYNASILFDNINTASNWLDQTTQLKGKMKYFAESNQERRWSKGRTAEFLTNWLNDFVRYQEEWGSKMVAPDILAAATDNNNHGLPASDRDPIIIPTNVPGTVTGCTMIHLPHVALNDTN
jgi:hypothetical protein